MAKVRNPHGVVQDTDSAYLVRDANGVVVETPPAYTKYDKWGNRVLSDATHYVKDVWGNTVDGTQPYSVRNAYGEVVTFTPDVGGGSLTPTITTDTFDWFGLGGTLSTPLPVGQFVNGDVFLVSAADSSVTALTPAAYVYDQPSGVTKSYTTPGVDDAGGPSRDPGPAWLNGAQINSGNRIYALAWTGSGDPVSNVANESSVPVGFDGRVLSESPPMVYSPSGAGGAIGGAYPGGHPLAGQYRNTDPAFRAAVLGGSGEIDITTGSEFTLSKAESRPDYVYRDRLQKLGHFTVLSQVPLVGAFRPSPAVADKSIPLYLSDLTLNDLPSLTPPVGFTVTPAQSIYKTSKPFDHSVTGSDGQRNLRARWEEIPYDPLNPATTGGDKTIAEFGRDIGWDFSEAALHLCYNVATPAEKEQIAINICQAAIDLCGRVDEGGNFYPVSTPGNHVQQWGWIVAVAAQLTRNSARGEYFRRFLTLETVSAFQGGLGFGRTVTLADTVKAPRVHDGDYDTGLLGYATAQVRPHLIGSTQGHANRAAGSMTSVMSSNYFMPFYNSIVGMALALRFMGGEMWSPRPETWNMLHQHADAMKWNTGGTFPNDDTVFNSGASRGVINAAVRDGWVAIPAPVDQTPLEGGASSVTVLRENGAGKTFTVGDENWVWARMRGLLQRRIRADMPPAAAFTVTVNGSPRTIDPGATDAKTNAAIQVRGENIGVAITGAAISPGDTVLLSYDKTAAGSFPLKFHDGTEVPSFTDLSCTVQIPNLVRVGTPDGASFGSATGTGNPNGLADQPKIFWNSVIPAYTLAKFGQNSTDPMTHVLVGMRVYLYDRPTSAIFTARLDTTSMRIRVRDTNANDMQVALGAWTANRTGMFSSAQVGNPNGKWVTIWVYVDCNPATPLCQARISDGTGTFITGHGAMSGGSSTPALTQIGMATPLRWMGFSSSVTEPTSITGITRHLPGALSECIVIAGTAGRDVTMPTPGAGGPLDNAVFDHTFDWGDEGQNVVVRTGSYGNAAEIYNPVFLADAQTGIIPNVGLWKAAPGIWLDSDGSRPWFAAPV